MNKGYLIANVILSVFLIWEAYIYRMFNYGELTNKPFYVALQGFEEKNRLTISTSNKDIVTTFIKNGITHKGKAYDLLGIPTRDRKFPYFWVVTNIEDKDVSSPYHVFYIPAGKEFYLPCSYLDQLEKEEEIISMVKDFLRARCIKE